MRNQEEIVQILRENLETAKAAHDRAREEFDRILQEIPSQIPHPDGDVRIRSAGRSNRVTMDAYAQALREFNALVIHQVIPERLRR